MATKLYGSVFIYLALAGIGFIGWTLPGKGCTPSFNQGCAKHISFDTFASGKAAGATVSFTVALTSGDLIVVSAVGEGGTPGSPLVVRVTSVSDSVGDIFSKWAEVTVFQPGTGDNSINLQIWTAFTKSNSVSITLTSNATNASMSTIGVVGTYRNVIGVGSANTTQSTNLIAPSGNFNITTVGSSSIIVGSAALENNVAGCPTNITPGTNLTQRGVICAQNGDVDIQDTVPHEFANAKTFEYSDSATPFFGNSILGGIELSPGFVGPLNVCTSQNIATKCPVTDTDSFCPLMGDTCHINLAGKTSGINTNQNLVINTEYCTGITTTALAMTSAAPIQLEGVYSSQSKNVTGAVALIRGYISTAPPSTIFGAGLCAAGQIGFVSSKVIYFTSGTTLTGFGPNEYPMPITGTSVSEAAASYYGWFTITWQTCNPICLGSTLQWAQWGAVNHSSITIYQVK